MIHLTTSSSLTNALYNFTATKLSSIEKKTPAPIIPKPKHPLKVHIWVGIGRKGSTGIVVFDGIMTSSYYTETILTHGLLPFIQKVYPNGHLFQQDNDPKHISKATQQFMRENDINWWNVWPSEPGFPSHRNGVGHHEETIGEKRNKDKRSTTSLHSTVLEYGYDGRALQSIH